MKSDTKNVIQIKVSEADTGKNECELNKIPDFGHNHHYDPVAI